jgi:hypothetical protein
MEAIDEIKTFEDHSENIDIFNRFIQATFKVLTVEEALLGKDVFDEIRDLNQITVDMKIFSADGRDLNQLNIRSMLKLNS